MTWTYSQNPSTSQKDEVRFLIGDTVSADPLLQDEEINYQLSKTSNVKLAAYICALAISAQFSRLSDKSVGKVNFSLSQKAMQYQRLAEKLQADASALAVPFAGGLQVTEKKQSLSDRDSVQPVFRRGLMDG